eukprot:gene5997-7470_t
MTIGILAGMGPKSTGNFLDKVVQECSINGCVNDIDYPPMMIYTVPTPFYINKPVDHSELKGAIVNGIKRLADTDVSAIGIPCNTAHIYYKELLNAVYPITLLNMITETVQNIPVTISKCTIFATDATIDSKLYQNAIDDAISQRQQQRSLQYIQKDEWQLLVNLMINNCKSPNGLVDAKSIWKTLEQHILDNDIECVHAMITHSISKTQFPQKGTKINTKQFLHIKFLNN